MQPVDAQVDGRALAGFNDLVVHLLLHLGHNLLDTCRVDASIGYQLMQCQAANLAANRVESTDDDGFGRIVHHDFHTRGSLQSADVASLTTDDAAFDLIVVNMEHRHAVLDGRFGGHALDGLDHDAFGLLVGGEFRIVHDVVDVTLCIAAGLVLQ